MCSFFKCNNLLIKVFKELNGVNMYNKKTKSKKKIVDNFKCITSQRVRS